MSFEPPRCPNVDCPQHHEPKGRFYRRRGYYQPQCRPEPVPRFLCLTCRKGFSRQTFRHDYRDRRPETNVPVFEFLTSGAGLRQTARKVKLDVHSVQKKMRKIASTCALLHANLSPRLDPGRTFLLDEEETYEKASIRPLTLACLIERVSWFLVDSAVGSIRRLAPEGTARRRRQERDEARHGRREDESKACVQRVLTQLLARVPEGAVMLQFDEKATYPVLARQVFGDRVTWQTTSSLLARGTFNPLFPINTTLAMTRDNNGRLRKKSWLVTKHRDRLFDQMCIFGVYRNYVRRRFNRDPKSDTPAKLLGLLPRELHAAEVLAWHQGWGPRSIHPMSYTGRSTVADKLQEAA